MEHTRPKVENCEIPIGEATFIERVRRLNGKRIQDKSEIFM